MKLNLKKSKRKESFRILEKDGLFFPQERVKNIWGQNVWMCVKTWNEGSIDGLEGDSYEKAQFNNLESARHFIDKYREKNKEKIHKY